jgi:hypothetical protein
MWQDHEQASGSCQGVALTSIKRIILAIYGLAAVCIFTWVPWRGDRLLRMNPVVTSSVYLGYAPVWSLPKPYVAAVQYEAALNQYKVALGKYLDSRVPPLGPQFDLSGGLVENHPTRSDNALGSKVNPPPGYVEVPAPKEKESDSLLQKPNEPRAPDGYFPSLTYGSIKVDYGRVLLEFGALTGLLLVAWMITPSVPAAKDQP